MYYYMGDPHFNFEDIITRCKRPFSSVEEMNQTIIDNINCKCSADDTLVIVGDITAGDNYIVPLLRQINCKKVLVIGNHDRMQLPYKKFRDCFESIHESLMIKDGEYDLFISHFPHAEWDGFYKGRFHFYGHVHNGTSGGAGLMKYLPTAVNVCCDVLGFMPMTAEELITKRLAEYVSAEKFFPEEIKHICRPIVDGRATKTLDIDALLAPHKVNALKSRTDYSFELNMSEDYKSYENCDEWGCAYAWIGEDRGVEYNFCIDGSTNSCAIYKTEVNEKTGLMETDYSICTHYEIDFDNPDWKEVLEDAMCEALITFFGL